jgi:hypothetical protein
VWFLIAAIVDARHDVAAMVNDRLISSFLKAFDLANR